MTSKVLMTDYVWPSIDPEREVLEAAGIEPVVSPDGSEASLIELADKWRPVAQPVPSVAV